MKNGRTVPATDIKTEFSNISRNDFPNDFVFGTATSAYQVEGGAAKDGRGLSVWDHFTWRQPENIVGRANGNVAVDMYTRYEEDIAMMKSMGFDSYRFSISWSRILPGGKLDRTKVDRGVNREGIDYYNDVINTLLANDIQPYATLFHWDLPLTLEKEYKGFLSEDIVNDFRDFAEVCFSEFGDRVKHWITLNEPWTYCIRGYVECAFPPAKHHNEDGSTPSPALETTNQISEVFVDKIWDIVSTHASAEKTGNNFIHYRGFNRVANDLHFITYSIHDDRTISIPTKEGLVQNKTIRTHISYKTQLLHKSSSSHHVPHHDPHHVSDECLEDLARDPYTAARNMLLAHAAAVQSYRKHFQKLQKGQIGITLVSHWFEPLTDSHNDKKAAERGLDFMLGWFLEPVLIGKYPESMIHRVPKENLAPFSNEESKLLKGSIDFLGLNYYTARYAAHDPNPTVHIGHNRNQHVKMHTEKDGIPIGEKCGASWLLIAPWGFHKLLKLIHHKYNNEHTQLPPIYITENGVADKMDNSLTAEQACRDEQRVNYYRDHLGYLLQAIKEGVNIKGYFAWSWCDNFEWVDGYDFRFGLIYIDYMNHLNRYPKDSAGWFSRFLLN